MRAAEGVEGVCSTALLGLRSSVRAVASHLLADALLPGIGVGARGGGGGMTAPSPPAAPTSIVSTAAALLAGSGLCPPTGWTAAEKPPPCHCRRLFFLRLLRLQS